MVAGGVIKANVKFDPDDDTPISGGDGGDAGGYAPLFGAFYTHPLGVRWRLGANMISLTGSVLEYDDDWTGRYLNTEVTLLTVGGQFVYADLGRGEIDNPNLEGDYKNNDTFFLALNANWKF